MKYIFANYLSINIVSLFLITSCSVLAKPVSTSSPNTTRTATILMKNTPSVTFLHTVTSTNNHSPSPTVTPTITPTPDICNPSHWQKDGIYVLSTDQYDALEPGGPNTFDRILISLNPAWEDFQQKIEVIDREHWTAGQIFDSFAWGFELGSGVNPAVILITYGVERDWALPTHGALAAKVDQIRASLYKYRLEWVLGKVDRSQYPPITNGATYALYRYFDGNKNQLETWCRTYLEVYGESPLKEYDH